LALQKGGRALFLALRDLGYTATMVVLCTKCGRHNQVPPTPPPPGQRYRCGVCGSFLPDSPAGSQAGDDAGTKAIAGATGGALLGWTIGGPPGAIVGALVGLFVGAKAGERNG